VKYGKVKFRKKIDQLDEGVFAARDPKVMEGHFFLLAGQFWLYFYIFNFIS